MPGNAAEAQKVLAYLRAAAEASHGPDLLPFTGRAIAHATKLTGAEVKAALRGLGGDVREHLVYVKIHLPDSPAGARAYKRLVKAGLVSRSWRLSEWLRRFG